MPVDAAQGDASPQKLKSERSAWAGRINASKSAVSTASKAISSVSKKTLNTQTTKRTLTSQKTASSLRRPGGPLSDDAVSRSVTDRSAADFSEDFESEEEDIDFTSLRTICRSFFRRCSRRAGRVRRMAAKAVKEEAHEAWGKTKTNHRLWALRRKCRCVGRRPSERVSRVLSGMSAATFHSGGSWKRRKDDEAKEKLKRDSGGEGGFGVQCFIIHNQGHLENYFDVLPGELNVGGSAKVYRAIERSTRIERAVKKIYKRGPVDVSRALQEVAIMKVLDHPNIVKLFETFQDDRHLFLVMELCGGGDLLDRLSSSGAYNEYQAAVIVRTVLMTLNYMHANGYVHRDIKPENVMFKDSRRDVMTSALRLVDFGFACKKPDEKTGPMTTKVGSPLYVAPEVIEGEYDERCDIWSTGVLAYVLLCGYPPFCGGSDAETLHAIRRGIYVFHRKHWQAISKPAKHLVRHMIEANRDKRLPMKDALGHPWLKARGVLRVQRMRDETVDRLLTFNTYHKLRRAAMLAVAYQLEAHEVRELVELFQGLDMNGDGLLTSPEFVKGVQACGIDETWITRMMASVDADNSGVIDFCEFLAATLDQQMYIKNHGAIFRAFRSFDQDDSGGLSREEIAETLRMTGPEDLQEAKDFFKDVDLNGDGVMDYGEFYSLLQHEIDPEKTVFKVEDEFELKRRSSLRSSRSSYGDRLSGRVSGRRSGRSSTERSSARSSARSSNEDAEIAEVGEEDDALKGGPSDADLDESAKKSFAADEEEPEDGSGSESAGSGSSSGSGSGSGSLSSVSVGSGSRSNSSSHSRSQHESSGTSGSRSGRGESTEHDTESQLRQTVSIKFKSSELSEGDRVRRPGRTTSSMSSGRPGRTTSSMSYEHSDTDEASSEHSAAAVRKTEERSKRTVSIREDA